MRVKAVIAYDGSAYHGFQKQNSTSQTIASAIEKALHSLHIDAHIVASGRTDAGVHATGQIIHFDLPEFWCDLGKLKSILNKKLHGIRFKHITKASQSFHARFSAKKRLYRYVFKTDELSVFEENYISCYGIFDKTLLQQALACFEGEHDFDYFHKTGTITHTTVRKIYHAAYKKHGRYHFIYFQANGFLRSQVRMMIDAAMACACGTMSIEALEQQLACEIRHTTKLASPAGLYLARITY